MSVVCRTVQRIDDPLPLAAFAADQNGFAGFFRENAVLWIVRTDSFDDEVFSGDVGFGDEIDVALGGNFRGSETLDQQIARLTGDVDGKIKHGVMGC